MSEDPSEGRGLNIATKILCALLVAGVVALAAAVFWYRGPDSALVLATRNDCLRSFDDATCRDIVARAFKIHAQNAPRFATSELCQLSYGEDGCRPADGEAGPLSFFVPVIAVILATRDSNDHVDALLPLYAGPANRGGTPNDSTPIYYRGRAIGTLQSKRFGGADISMVRDPSGNALTGESVRSLSRN